MTVAGHQDFWRAGSRIVFKRDPVDGVEQPPLDLGIIETANPNFNTELVELYDSSSGERSLFQQRASKLDETYDVVVSNLNLDNLSMFWLADPPTDWSQAASSHISVHSAFYGYPIPLQTANSKTYVQDKAFFLNRLEGVTYGSIFGIRAIDTGTTGTNVIDYSTAGTLGGAPDQRPAVGDRVIIFSDMADDFGAGFGGAPISNIACAGTYTVASVSDDGVTPPFTITLNETLPANFTNGYIIVNGSITGTGSDNLSGILPIQSEAQYGFENIPGTNFKNGAVDIEIENVERAIVRVIPYPDPNETERRLGYLNHTSGIGLTFYFNTSAVSSAKRSFNPQTNSTGVTGDCEIYYNRDGSDEVSVRTCRVSITPNASNMAAEGNFSNITLTFRVLADTSGNAGTLTYVKGAFPSYPTS